MCDDVIEDRAAAASRLAREAADAARSHARFAANVKRSAQAALARIAEGGGAGDLLRELAGDLSSLRDMAESAGCWPSESPQFEFCRPDIIMDGLVDAARPGAAIRGVTIDYLRSFSEITMLGAPTALASMLRACLDKAISCCDRGEITLRANFHDAHDGRRMLRLVIAGETGLNLKPFELEPLRAAAGAVSGAVILVDGAMIVMARALLAAPLHLLTEPADIEAYSS